MTLKLTAKVKIDDRRLKQIQRTLIKAASKHLEVGFFGGKPHPADPSMTVASIAAIQEFGAPAAKIPERPFMQTTVRETTVSKVLAQSIRNIVRGVNTPITHGIWGVAGVHMSKEMSRTITNFSFPPNAPVTVEIKGFDDPLIETGHMRDSVEYRVK